MQLIELCGKLDIKLGKQKYAKTNTPIPNDHPILDEYSETIQTVASALGVDLKEAKHSFQVSTKKGLAIYGPLVALFEGQPALYWGKQVLPLANVPITPIPAEYNGKGYLDFDINDEVTLTVPMSLVNVKVASADLRKALKSGVAGLTSFLKEGFILPGDLKDLKPGEYQVTAYRTEEYQGDTKYQVYVVGNGWTRVNKAVARRLAAEPVISQEKPAVLTVGEVTEYTSSGHAIIPAYLEPAEDAEIEVYDFV